MAYLDELDVGDGVTIDLPHAEASQHGFVKELLPSTRDKSLTPDPGRDLVRVVLDNGAEAIFHPSFLVLDQGESDGA